MKNVYLCSIAFKCPKIVRNKECPLLEIDHLEFHEKIDWIDKLKNNRIEAILKHHFHCSKSYLNS